MKKILMCAAFLASVNSLQAKVPETLTSDYAAIAVPQDGSRYCAELVEYKKASFPLNEKKSREKQRDAAVNAVKKTCTFNGHIFIVKDGKCFNIIRFHNGKYFALERDLSQETVLVAMKERSGLPKLNKNGKQVYKEVPKETLARRICSRKK